MSRTVYGIEEQAYEYDDEYYRPKGYENQNVVWSKRSEANEEALKLNRKWIDELAGDNFDGFERDGIDYEIVFRILKPFISYTSCDDWDNANYPFPKDLPIEVKDQLIDADDFFMNYHVVEMELYE